LLEALHTKDKETALSLIAQVANEPIDMKLFVRLLLEHIRAVMLLRNAPSQKDRILASFGPEAQTRIETYAAGTTALNSHLLLKLLGASELMSRSPLPQLPLEIAIVEMFE
jgi:DNA polymerase III gamma/tau subunit